MDELIDHFLCRLAVEKGYSEHTLRAYATDMCAFGEFLRGRGRTFTQANVRDVRGFLAQLQMKGLARATIAATASRRATPSRRCARRAAREGCPAS
jgi:site-specific recombinase XerD